MLEQDEYGYPPTTGEGLWAMKRAEDTFELDNIPFFVRGISAGDVVHAEFIAGEYLFVSTIIPSTNSTYRLLFNDVVQVKEVRRTLLALGCDSEQSHIPELISVNVPDHVDGRALTSYLDDQCAKNVLFEFEEGALRGRLSEL